MNSVMSDCIFELLSLKLTGSQHELSSPPKNRTCVVESMTVDLNCHDFNTELTILLNFIVHLSTLCIGRGPISSHDLSSHQQRIISWRPLFTNLSI